MNHHVLGIDPGTTGGWALIAPGLPVALGRWAKDGVGGAREILDRISYYGGHIFMERVSSSPIQSQKSAFTFGENFGHWKGLVSALRSPHRKREDKTTFTLVQPQTWQKPIPGIAGIRVLNLTAAQKYRMRKNLIKDYIKELYPVPGITLENADALAIAHYGLNSL